jgi:hypothetical protein
MHTGVPVACCLNGNGVEFRPCAGFLCHGYVEWVHERAGRGWRGKVGTVKCRLMYGVEEKCVCLIRNTADALGVHGTHGVWLERVPGGGLQGLCSAGEGWAMGAVSRGSRWRGSEAWLASYASASAGRARGGISEGERDGEVRWLGAYRWGTGGPLGRWQCVDWGLEAAWGRREGREKSWQDCLGFFPSFC